MKEGLPPSQCRKPPFSEPENGASLGGESLSLRVSPTPVRREVSSGKMTVQRRDPRRGGLVARTCSTETPWY